jgi:hypothetical protein
MTGLSKMNNQKNNQKNNEIIEILARVKRIDRGLTVMLKLRDEIYDIICMLSVFTALLSGVVAFHFIYCYNNTTQ